MRKTPPQSCKDHRVLRSGITNDRNISVDSSCIWVRWLKMKCSYISFHTQRQYLSVVQPFPHSLAQKGKVNCTRCCSPVVWWNNFSWVAFGSHIIADGSRNTSVYQFLATLSNVVHHQVRWETNLQAFIQPNSWYCHLLVGFRCNYVKKQFFRKCG